MSPVSTGWNLTTFEAVFSVLFKREVAGRRVLFRRAVPGRDAVEGSLFVVTATEPRGAPRRDRAGVAGS